MWGSIQSHGFLPDTVIVMTLDNSWSVGKASIGSMRSGWYTKKLETFTNDQLTAEERVRGLIRDFYADLKDCRRTPTHDVHALDIWPREVVRHRVYDVERAEAAARPSLACIGGLRCSQASHERPALGLVAFFAANRRAG